MLNKKQFLQDDVTSEESVETEEESEEVFEIGDKDNESKQLMKVIDAEKDGSNRMLNKKKILHDDVKSHTSEDSVETEKESKEVFKIRVEMVIDFAHKEGSEANDEDRPDIDSLSNINTQKNQRKQVSVEFVSEPAEMKVPTVKSRVTIASNSTHTVRLHNTISVSYHEEGKMKRSKVEKRLRKGYYPGGKNRQINQARRDSLRHEFQKPKEKLTVAQAVSLHDRFVAQKEKTEEKKLLLRKEREERELLYLPSNSQ